MDCAFDGDRIIVVAKVDFANFRQCGPLLTQLSWNENWVCEIGLRRPPLVSELVS